MMLIKNFLYILVLATGTAAAKAEQAITYSIEPLTEATTVITDTGSLGSRIDLYTELKSTFTGDKKVLGQPTSGGIARAKPLDWNLGIGFQVTPKIQVGYHQKINLDILGAHSSTFSIREPKLFARFFDPFNVKYKHGIEAYLKANTNPKDLKEGQIVDIGARSKVSFPIKDSRWSFNLKNEIAFIGAPLFKRNETIMTFDINPEAEYQITSNLNSFHGIILKLSNYYRDAFLLTTLNPIALPSLENGIAWNITKSFTITTAVHNYLHKLPSLDSTWLTLDFKWVLPKKL